MNHRWSSIWETKAHWTLWCLRYKYHLSSLSTRNHSCNYQLLLLTNCRKLSETTPISVPFVFQMYWPSRKGHVPCRIGKNLQLPKSCLWFSLFFGFKNDQTNQVFLSTSTNLHFLWVHIPIPRPSLWLPYRATLRRLGQQVKVPSPWSGLEPQRRLYVASSIAPTASTLQKTNVSPWDKENDLQKCL